MDPEVFISYSYQDEQEALDIVSKLESNGLNCWISKKNIITGDFTEKIIKSINNCKVLILVYSANSNKSKHVRNEVKIAFHKNIPIIPFRLDKTPPNEGFEYCLGSEIWIDAYPKKEEQLETLVEAVNEVLKNCCENKKKKDTTNYRKRKLIYIAAASCFILVSIIIFLIHTFNIFDIKEDYFIDIQPEMVFVEGGVFIFNEEGFGINGNADTVVLKDYYIGKYEVTQKEWCKVMDANPSKWKGKNFPVNNVSYNEVLSFLIKLSSETGKNYRLPTEAEWEYAAHGGSKTNHYKYSGSNKIPEVAWYKSNSSMKTHRVGKKTPNELGLYDMSGNVWEWCQSLFQERCLPDNANGTVCEVYYVLRGGSFGLSELNCRVASRDGAPPSFNTGDGGIGFRLVLDVDSNSNLH